MIGFYENESRITFARRKYRIDDLTVLEMRGSNGKPLGAGPVMAPETFQKFLDLDPSSDHKYLDWMLFQAGGGQELMEKSISLWEGESASDSQSLKNQCREDFLNEKMRGYTDDGGNKHIPITRNKAEAAWTIYEPSCQFEFLMGDQDVAFEDGFGFFRFWPGKDSIYQKVVNAVKLFHNGLAKLSANNDKFDRAHELTKTDPKKWSEEEAAFMAKFNKSPIPRRIELDIYRGWKPGSYSQAGAVYKNLDDLLGAVDDLRKMRVLSDIRAEIVYEDDIVVAVSPLTVGASLRYGSLKWCTSNRSDFDRSFDPRTAANHNWKTYSARGPLVYLTFKVPMPDWLGKLAIHIELAKRKDKVENWIYVDNQNNNSGTTLDSIKRRITGEHALSLAALPPKHEDDTFRYGLNKQPGRRVWDTELQGQAVLLSLNQCLLAISKWVKDFDVKKVISDHLTEALSSPDMCAESTSGIGD